MVQEVLSIFTTATRPHERGDTFNESMACYNDLADEVVVTGENWPQEFSWEYIGQTFQQGYKACIGDVVIHADLDFIFHEKDFEDIHRAAQQMLDNNLPAMSMYKYQFVLPDRYNLKSRLVVMVNKRDYGDKIKFDSGGDLAQPSLNGRYITPDAIPESKIGFYNYEKPTKTKEQIMDDVGRMDRAYYRHFRKPLYSGFAEAEKLTNEDAYEGWYHMVSGRLNKPQQKIKLEDHPKYIQETIKKLTPDQFGWNGFGIIDEGVYK